MARELENFKERKKCKCCLGTGIQVNLKTGLRQHCPCCFGTGLEMPAERIIYHMERE